MIEEIMYGQTTTHLTLLARIADGQDPAAWHEFCARYGDLIRRFARSRGLQSADVDDVLQDVLMVLTKTMPGFQYDPAKGRFRSFLKTLVIRSVYRKTFQNRTPRPQEDIERLAEAPQCDEEVEGVWEQEWRQYHIRHAMRTISVEFNETDLAAYRLYAVQGLGAGDTAKALGQSVEQVYQAKSRILKRLSALIEVQIQEEG